MVMENEILDMSLLVYIKNIGEDIMTHKMAD